MQLLMPPPQRDKVALAKAKKLAEAKQKLRIATGKGESDTNGAIQATQKMEKAQAKREGRKGRMRKTRRTCSCSWDLWWPSATTTTTTVAVSLPAGEAATTEAQETTIFFWQWQILSSSDNDSTISGTKEADSPPTKRCKRDGKKWKDDEEWKLVKCQCGMPSLHSKPAHGHWSCDSIQL